MAAVGDYTLSININSTFTGGSLGTPRSSVGRTYSQTFEAGTSAGQTNEGWTGAIALTASTPQTLDLENLVGETGRAVTFTKVKMLAIRNTHATATVTIGNAASNAFLPGWSGATNTVALGPGNTLFLTSAAGFTVDATHSDLKLDPGSNAITVEIMILGNS